MTSSAHFPHFHFSIGDTSAYKTRCLYCILYLVNTCSPWWSIAPSIARWVEHYRHIIVEMQGMINTVILFIAGRLPNNICDCLLILFVYKEKLIWIMLTCRTFEWIIVWEEFPFSHNRSLLLYGVGIGISL